MVQRRTISVAKRKEVCLVWNQLDVIKVLPIQTTDFLYVWLIGDRSIDEKDFSISWLPVNGSSPPSSISYHFEIDRNAIPFQQFYVMVVLLACYRHNVDKDELSFSFCLQSGDSSSILRGTTSGDPLYLCRPSLVNIHPCQ
jgi:hypothetical protein